MTYSKVTMVTTKHEFVLMVDRALRGCTLGRGWGTYPVTACPYCGAHWTPSQVVGSRGYICPNTQCGFQDWEYVWQGEEGQLECDGSWVEPVGWKNATILNQN